MTRRRSWNDDMPRAIPILRSDCSNILFGMAVAEVCRRRRRDDDDDAIVAARRRRANARRRRSRRCTMRRRWESDGGIRSLEAEMADEEEGEGGDDDGGSGLLLLLLRGRRRRPSRSKRDWRSRQRPRTSTSDGGASCRPTTPTTPTDATASRSRATYCSIAPSGVDMRWWGYDGEYFSAFSFTNAFSSYNFFFIYSCIPSKWYHSIFGCSAGYAYVSIAPSSCLTIQNMTECCTR